MNSADVLHEFRFVGARAPGRAFPGFPGHGDALHWYLACREPQRLSLQRGDLLSVDGLAIGEVLGVLAVNNQGHAQPDLLGLSADPNSLDSDYLDPGLFDTAPVDGWLAAVGLRNTLLRHVATLKGDGQMLVLEAQADCETWLVRPASTADHVSGATGSAVRVALKRVDASAHLLPPPLGPVREEFTVTRGTARAYEVGADEIVQIIDVEGQQCSDFVAFRAAELEAGVEKMIDATATRSSVRAAYPVPGLFDKFFDADLRPMLNVLQDTCGRHDAFGLACTARSYEERGFPGHRNCSDNISAAVGPYGVASRAGWPAINFFWSTWIDAHHHGLMTEESWSRPGDYVAMRALAPMVCVTTACPDDLDPINGWNPTDIHVRIYRPNAWVRRAVAYREKEDAPMAVSRESAFHARTSMLTSHFAPARDLWVPVSYPGVGTTAEYWACRDNVTLQDMSSLRKYDVVGPDAERLLQRVMSRDVARLAVWRGTYALVCDDTGTVIDDGTLFRIAPEIFRWCCGNEESARMMREVVAAEGYQVRIHAMGGALPNLALQGPRSRDLLSKVVFTQPHVPSLVQMKWFGATVARLHDREGIPFMLTRTGYTGELGYELFCAERDAVALWDGLMVAGEEFELQPMGGAALEVIRIEAGLAAANAEFAPGVDAFEAGLGFAVDLNKADFVGKEALARNAASPRRLLKGLVFDCDDVPAAGAHVFVGERPVGTVTSATRSPSFECAIAMARLAVEHAQNDTTVEVGQLDGRMKRLSARVTNVPFLDPKRERARA